MDVPLARAVRSLRALSVGDAFGERFFVPVALLEPWLAARAVPIPGPWRWTDDTAMAISLVETLAEGSRPRAGSQGDLDLDGFADRLARRYTAEPWRGYGMGAHDLLAAVSAGTPWRAAAAALFGTGSFGNGAAMRVAPLGAFFADDLERCAANADASARVTHAHPEGRAGAVAVAVAAALFARGDDLAPDALREQLFDQVLAHTPPSEVREGIEKARTTRHDALPGIAAHLLGNGARVTAMDTVPLCLWAAAAHPRDLRAALWTTVAALGDRDTTCAIVAGILGSARSTLVPEDLAAAVEPLPRIDAR